MSVSKVETNLEPKPTGNGSADGTDTTNGAGAPLVQTTGGPSEEIPLVEMIRSGTNRDIETKGEEWKNFVNSIRKHGIIQPLLLRPLPQALDMSLRGKKGVPRYEIVAGERRWLGADEAGLKTAPAIVKVMSDREALEKQAIENFERKDLSPIEEAEKYQQLLDRYEKDGLSKEKAMVELCEKMGKAKSTVYEALRLLKLPPEAKAAVKEGRLPPSHAGLVLKLEKYPATQKEVVAQILTPGKQDEKEAGGAAVLSFRATKDLVDEAEELAKARAKWAKLVEAHFNKGGKFLSEEECARVMPYGSKYIDPGSGYVSADTYCRAYENYYGKLMGKKAPKPTLAHGNTYLIAEVYEANEALAAIVANGKKPPRRSNDDGSRRAAAAKVQSAKTRQETAKRRAIISAVVKRAAAGNGRWTLELFKFIVGAMRQRILADTAREMFNRRALKREDYKKPGGYASPHYVWLDGEIAGIKHAPQAVGLIVDMAIAMDLTVWSGQRGSGARLLDQACGIFGVDKADAMAQEPAALSVVGLKWLRKPEGDFKFNSSGVCEKPATLILPFPKASGITVELYMARAKDGYVTASKLQVKDSGGSGLPSIGRRPHDVFKTVREGLQNEAMQAVRFLKANKAQKKWLLRLLDYVRQIGVMPIDEGRGLCMTTSAPQASGKNGTDKTKRTKKAAAEKPRTSNVQRKGKKKR